MLKLGWRFALLVVVMMVVVGCGRVATPPPSPVENTGVAAALTSTPSPIVNTPVAAAATPTLSSEPVTPTITTLTTTTARELVFQAECPTKRDFLSSPQLFPGTILFNLGRIVDLEHVDRIFKDDDIWAILAGSEEPYLVPQLLTGSYISSDNTYRLRAIHNSSDLTQEVIIYNLENGEETHLDIPHEYWFVKWKSPHHAQFEGNVTSTSGVGETRNLLVIDLKTQEVTTFTQELTLPDYAFYDGDTDKGLFYGYRSIDPHEQIILYTAQNEGDTDFEVRLLNIQTGKILWRGETQLLSDTFPQWSADGSKVLFDVSDPQGWTKIISLTRDGQVEELPSQPFPFVEEGQLSGYSRSPDGRYLFYTAAETDLQTFTFKIRAFVIDIATWHVSEICDPDGSFVSSIPSRGATDDLWLPNGQFVYRIWHENDEVLWHSLHLLDIPSWTAYSLFEAESGYGISILNWTQTEFPEE